MEKLKPCPFCGNEPHTIECVGGNQYRCPHCHTGGLGMWKSAWNSRPREERLEGLLREARSLLPPHHDLKLKIDAALKDEGKE